MEQSPIRIPIALPTVVHLSHRSRILIAFHPPELLPHIQLIPLLRPAFDLPAFHLKDGTRAPLGLLPRRLDPIVGFAAVAPFRRVPQQHQPVLGKHDVV